MLEMVAARPPPLPHLVLAPELRGLQRCPLGADLAVVQPGGHVGQRLGARGLGECMGQVKGHRTVHTVT